MQYKNRPPHIYLDNTYYFLTSRTLKSVSFFNNDKKKQILLNVIKRGIQKFKCKLVAWVVLSNHYHVLFKLKNCRELGRLIGNIHTNSARLLNKADDCRGRKVWWNYWDHIIRDEKDFYMHLNYIHQNPVKHSHVKRMEGHHFSSYKDYMLKYGKEWLDSCFELYPIVDFISSDV